MAADISRVACSRGFNTLRQGDWVVDHVVHQNLVCKVCYLRRSGYIIYLRGLQICQSETLVSQGRFCLTLFPSALIRTRFD